MIFSTFSDIADQALFLTEPLLVHQYSQAWVCVIGRGDGFAGGSVRSARQLFRQFRGGPALRTMLLQFVHRKVSSLALPLHLDRSPTVVSLMTAAAALNRTTSLPSDMAGSMSLRRAGSPRLAIASRAAARTLPLLSETAA